MAYRVVTIANCRTASIRRAPWIPLYDKDIVGIRDGPQCDSNTVKMGQTIEIDTDEICYDWTGRMFYKTKRPRGWIYEGCIDLGDDSHG
jgi:hypothetical protein